jgi:hypothetical protein
VKRFLGVFHHTRSAIFFSEMMEGFLVVFDDDGKLGLKVAHFTQLRFPQYMVWVEKLFKNKDSACNESWPCGLQYMILVPRYPLER